MAPISVKGFCERVRIAHPGAPAPNTLRLRLAAAAHAHGFRVMTVFVMLDGPDAKDAMNTYRRLLRENPQYVEEGEELEVIRRFDPRSTEALDGELYSAVIDALEFQKGKESTHE